MTVFPGLSHVYRRNTHYSCVFYLSLACFMCPPEPENPEGQKGKLSHPYYTCPLSPDKQVPTHASNTYRRGLGAWKKSLIFPKGYNRYIIKIIYFSFFGFIHSHTNEKVLDTPQKEGSVVKEFWDTLGLTELNPRLRGSMTQSLIFANKHRGAPWGEK